MKSFFTIVVVISISFITHQLAAQTIWNGDRFTFQKLNGADWTLEANQDRITDNVWITRANNKGIFNIAKNDAFIGNGADPANFGPSPEGTEWAFGTTAQGIANLEFMTWTMATTVNSTDSSADPLSLLGEEMVVHLIEDDLYIEIKFLSWGVGGQGGMGSFVYERAFGNLTNTTNLERTESQIKLFPNPSTDFLIIQNLEKPQNILIYDASGQVVQQLQLNPNDQIDITALPSGMHVIQFEDGRITTFVKQ
jgi:hypothetical protein